MRVKTSERDPRREAKSSPKDDRRWYSAPPLACPSIAVCMVGDIDLILRSKAYNALQSEYVCRNWVVGYPKNLVLYCTQLVS